jgi:hypothetical protein
MKRVSLSDVSICPPQLTYSFYLREPRVFVEAVAWEGEALASFMPGRWRHALYLSFSKKDFKYFNYPKVVGMPEYTWRSYDYYNSSFKHVELNGGITFYEERLVTKNDSPTIKIGADYQHLGDEEFSLANQAQAILYSDGVRALNSLLELHKEMKYEKYDV